MDHKITAHQKILEENFLTLKKENYPRLVSISSSGAVFECKLPPLLSIDSYMMTIDGPVIVNDCHNYSVKCTVPFYDLKLGEKDIKSITPEFALKYAVFVLDSKTYRYNKVSGYDNNRILEFDNIEQIYVNY